MAERIITIDLNFMGIQGAIACYLIPHKNGAVLIESGPGSTLPELQSGLQNLGYQPGDISDVFLTHIHLDHAGAAGWFARQGARIYVHPNGASHLLNPEKLLASAKRIYGEMMDVLWGEFLSVPEDRLSVLQDEQVVEVDGILLRSLDTPGHADHHFVYLFEDICFSGDIGGVRLGGTQHIRLPMPPPELHLEKWRMSLHRLRQQNFSFIAPTHFGIFSDAGWHLAALGEALDDVEDWITANMPADPAVEQINQQLTDWSRQRAKRDRVPEAVLQAYESANPTWMSGYGIQRYWRKYRLPQES